MHQGRLQQEMQRPEGSRLWARLLLKQQQEGAGQNTSQKQKQKQEADVHAKPLLPAEKVKRPEKPDGRPDPQQVNESEAPAGNPDPEQVG